MPLSPATSLTRDLVRTNTVNPPGMEEKSVLLLGNLLEKAGFRIRTHAFEPGRLSLVARMGANDRDGLCMTGHLDTVPLGEKPWTTDPFGGEIMDNALWGRGSADMKAGVAAMVVAACSMAAAHPDPSHAGPALEIVLTASEENGCFGARDLAAHDLLGRCGAVVVGEPTNNRPMLGHKGVFWLEATFSGRTAHAAYPHLGDNALLKAARAALAVDASLFAADPHAVMGSPTVNIARLTSGDNYNSVPDKAVLGMDIRSTALWPHARIREQVETATREFEPKFRILADMPPLWSEPDTPWITRVFDQIEARNTIRPKPEIASFYTDGGVLGPAYGNVPTIILGPGDSAHAHQVDEHILVERIDQAVVLYTELIRDWFAATA